MTLKDGDGGWGKGWHRDEGMKFCSLIAAGDASLLLSALVWEMNTFFQKSEFCSYFESEQTCWHIVVIFPVRTMVSVVRRSRILLLVNSITPKYQCLPLKMGIGDINTGMQL